MRINKYNKKKNNNKKLQFFLYVRLFVVFLSFFFSSVNSLFLPVFIPSLFIVYLIRFDLSFILSCLFFIASLIFCCFYSPLQQCQYFVLISARQHIATYQTLIDFTTLRQTPVLNAEGNYKKVQTRKIKTANTIFFPSDLTIWKHSF